MFEFKICCLIIAKCVSAPLFSPQGLLSGGLDSSCILPAMPLCVNIIFIGYTVYLPLISSASVWIRDVNRSDRPAPVVSRVGLPVGSDREFMTGRSDRKNKTVKKPVKSLVFGLFCSNILVFLVIFCQIF